MTLHIKNYLNIAEKHKITPSLLGDKDNAISSLIKMVNLTEGLSKNVKRILSDSLKREYSDYESTPAMGSKSSDSNEYEHSYVDGFEEILINKGNAYTENYQGYNIIEDERTHRRSTLLASYCSLLLGIVVAVITFSLDSAVWARMIQILPAFLAFLLCISMLVSLIDAKVLKDVEYFRKLVYKIIVLLVLLVIEIIVAII